MIDGRSVLGLITARGGSLGVPGKNLREVGGRSLIERTIDAANESRAVDRLILSSDDPEIIQAALLAGCEVPFVRPAELSTPEASSIAVVHHALEAVVGDYDLLVLLQPTSPLRAAGDIDGTVRAMVEQEAPACISVCLSDRSPYWLLSLDAEQRLSPVMSTKLANRRQDLPPAYYANGAVYAARCDWIREHNDFLAPETVAYVMPKERSVDIDDETDLLFAEMLWQKLAAESREPLDASAERRARA